MGYYTDVSSYKKQVWETVRKTSAAYSSDPLLRYLGSKRKFHFLQVIVHCKHWLEMPIMVKIFYKIDPSKDGTKEEETVDFSEKYHSSDYKRRRIFHIKAYNHKILF